jgi:hypothetical protein
MQGDVVRSGKVGGVISDHEAEMVRRVYADAEAFHEVRAAWRIVHDYGGTFTTPEERLAAGEMLRQRLG